MRRFWLKNVLGRVKLGVRHIVSFSLPPACQKAGAASCKLQSDLFLFLAWGSAGLCELGTRDVGQIDMSHNNTSRNQPTNRS
jgi:hypothetical protein